MRKRFAPTSAKLETYIRVLCTLFLVPFTPRVHTADTVISAEINENDLQGSVQFKSDATDEVVIVSAFIRYIGNATVENVSWTIRELPVDYTILDQRCTNQQLGPIRQDLDSMFKRLPLNKEAEFSVSSEIFALTGIQGIWLSSLLLELPDGRRACSTISVSRETDLKIGKVKFYGPVFGTIHFFWIGIRGSVTDAVIVSDLYHIHKHRIIDSQHKWGIFVTDILETSHDKTKLECNALQLAYNDLNDLSSTLGKLKVGRKAIYRYPTLSPIDLNPKDHTYYVAVYDDVHKDSFLSCGSIVLLSESVLKSFVEADGSRAKITFHQRSPFDPTTVSVNISTKSPQSVGGFRIHSLPVTPNYHNCHGIKDVYDPTNKGIAEAAPPPGEKTQDAYAVGDLSGKLGYSANSVYDLFLPLSGQHSVLHRTIAIYRKGPESEEAWLCGILVAFTGTNSDVKLPMVSAEVIFQYPISGRVLFRQLAEQQYSDTVIIVESLLYSDGSTDADSLHHNWTVNEKPPGKDYYNWQNRCDSAGPVYSPYKLPGNKDFGRVVNLFDYAMFTATLGTLAIVARKARDQSSRSFFVNPNLPLSGPHSIVGKSLVVYDENGPKARGNRLACSKITSVHRRKVAIRDWFGNDGDSVGIMGDVEMYQLSGYDTVDVEMDVQGLHNVEQYHIHMVPVEEELQFPCENSSLYEVWNPFNVSEEINGGPQKTYDQFRMGDLSGKYGDWTDMTTVNSVHNDSYLQMFGHNSLIGRSFVITKRDTNRRWACATIERGYSPMEARELRAIASFHHPQGFVYGYIRMTQLIHSDDSKSDTVIEVNLRYGKENQNVTHDHFWLVYVNPVGVDAIVEAKHTRCTAAGYVWNPNFIQLAAPLNDVLYYQECGPDQPYRCYAGDLSGRLGTISIGAERKVFSDSNLPLEGEASVMGKSIVILDKNRGHDKFSCANIQPDKDIIKYANIRKSLKFETSQFLAEVREILGVPEWMLTVDNRKTKILHNGACMQLLFHFKGPEANKIEQDFSHLMRTGKLDSPTIYNAGYNVPTTRKKRLNYQNCPPREADDKKKYGGSSGSCIGRASLLVLSGSLLLSVLSLQ